MERGIRRLTCGLLCLAVLLSGASLLPTRAQGKPHPRPVLRPAPPLLTIAGQGGRTVSGLGHSLTTIGRDGRLTVSDNGGLKTTRLTASEMSRLLRIIKQTDFRALRARKHVGPPPSAYDGQDVTYTFATPHGVETLSNTQTEIDPRGPLFHLLETLLAKYARA